MKTDKEWLKETVRKLCDYEDDNRLNIKAYKMIGLIDKLDEPEVERLNKKIIELDHFNSELIRDNNQFRNELDNQEVLSQEWIDEHEIHYNHWVGAVPVTELQNLLVPEQDEREQLETAYKDILDRGEFWFDDKEYKVVPKQELPVIPKFVAEWYEKEGKGSGWWNWFYKWGRDESRTELEAKTIRWMQDYNEEAFVNMFLHGYAVVKEQKYQVIIRDGEYTRLYLCKHDGNVTIGTNDNYIEKCPEVTYLTEQEIKDYDERYWPFAVKVKELEE